MRALGQHAIVIGASMGGLAAARVLADRYRQVTLLDRDTLPDCDEPRKGVPHGRHAHGLLTQGREVLEAYFPGLTDELVANGALKADPLAEGLWFDHGVYLTQSPCSLTGLQLSRPMLEGHVRRRLLQLSNVRVLDRCQVSGLTVDRNSAVVTGVELQRSEPTSAKETLPADLVVDAMGRGSRTPAWLAACGYAPPDEDSIEVGISYTTRLYRRHPEQVRGNRVVVVKGRAPDHRFGFALHQEDDSWIVTLGGYLGDAAPADEPGFLAFAQSLPAAEIYTVVRDAEPRSPFCVFRFPATVRRRYERLERFPAGYLVLGDALCSFNPAYAQGMTTALLEADTLAACLATGTERLAERFFGKVAAIIDAPWQIAISNDLDNPGLECPRTLTGRFFNWYMGKLYRAGARDASIATRFLEVANLMAPPASLLRPTTALRTLRGNMSPVLSASLRPARKGRPAPSDAACGGR